MGEARDFKFGVRIDPGKSHLTNDKVPLKGAWSRSRVEFLNFKPPSVNPERVKLETSNLVHGYILASPILWTTKCPYNGRGQGPGAEFLNFKPLP